MFLIGHLALLGVALVSLFGASLRIAGRMVDAAGARVLGATAVCAGLVISEPLLIGLSGHGANPYLLTVAAVLTWWLVRFTVVGAPVPLRDQLAAAWGEAGDVSRAAIGALAVLVVAVTAYQLAHPIIGWDGAVYHVAQPAVWIGDGHPGSLHQTVAGFPTQAYPKSFELLVFWACAIARTPAVLTPLLIGLDGLAVLATMLLLRELRCSTVVSTVATAAALLIPWHVVEFGNVYNDVAAIAFLAAAIALCAASRREPAALGLAIVAAGVGVSIKTTAVPLAVVAIVWAAWIAARSALRSHRVATLLLAAFGTGLAGLWYVVNAVTYHAPAWPFSTWPDGPPQPYIWRALGATFLTEPKITLKAVGAHDLFQIVGGIPILLGGSVIVAAMALARGTRPLRLVMGVGLLAVAGQTLLWAAAPFTGISHGFVPLVVSTIRYLDIAPAAAAIVLALAARERGALRWLASAFLLGALVLSLVEDHHWLAGQTPRWQVCLAAALVGGLAGGLSRELWRWRPISLRHVAVAPAAVVIAATTFAPAGTSYLSSYLAVPVLSVAGEAPILDYLRQQPGWVHGDAPVTAGYAADANFAGPHFSHPLRYLRPSASCADIAAAARRGWVVVWPVGHTVLYPAGYSPGAACADHPRPVAVIGAVRIYAPPGFVATGTPPPANP